MNIEKGFFKSNIDRLDRNWTDYKKAYDMVPHSWITECLDLFGVEENNSLLVNSNSLLVKGMEKWKVMLCSGNSDLREIEIERGIFQGD